jgi:protein phosphatase
VRFIIKKQKKSSDSNSRSDSIRIKPISAIHYAGLSDKGLRRASNKDSYGVFPEDIHSFMNPKGQLFIVADGIGGLIDGKEASEYAVDIVQKTYFSNQKDEIAKNLLDAFEKANKKICQTLNATDPFQKIGTTCTALLVTQNQAYIAHVGDTSIYRVRENEIVKLTEDHTEIADQVRTGVLTREEAKHHPESSVLSRALGSESDVEIEIHESVPIQGGDRFVLCSDGLGKISSEEIKDIVISKSPQEASEKFVQMANERGGEDNITVLVLHLDLIR